MGQKNTLAAMVLIPNRLRCKASCSIETCSSNSRPGVGPTHVQIDDPARTERSGSLYRRGSSSHQRRLEGNELPRCCAPDGALKCTKVFWTLRRKSCESSSCTASASPGCC